MKLSGVVKLHPTPAQADALRRTLELANAACNHVSAVAWKTQTFGQYRLHHTAYRSARERFDLTAQMAVRCIAKVAHAYKLDRKRPRSFRALGAIAYDDRILRWYLDRSEVSIWTADGRQTNPFVCGEHARALLACRRGESDLFVREGRWFLAFTAWVEAPQVDPPSDWLGIDLGITNLAVTSDGEAFSGAQVNGLRVRHERMRKRLQAKGTKSALRRLKRRRRKQRRFHRHTNHRIAKQLVAVAQGTGRGIALEDLTGIRTRLSARKRERSRLGNWGFAHLRHCLSY